MLSIKKSTAVAALTMSLLFSGGSALAVSNGGGNSGNAPGQANAMENCEATIDRQIEKGVSAGGGKKAGVLAPTNCDKFFNQP